MKLHRICNPTWLASAPIPPMARPSFPIAAPLKAAMVAQWGLNAPIRKTPKALNAIASGLKIKGMTLIICVRLYWYASVTARCRQGTCRPTRANQTSAQRCKCRQQNRRNLMPNRLCPLLVIMLAGISPRQPIGISCASSFATWFHPETVAQWWVVTGSFLNQARNALRRRSWRRPMTALRS